MSHRSSSWNVARQKLRSARNVWERFGLREPDGKVARDAAEFWSGDVNPDWRSHSHWVDGLGEQWTRLGTDSLRRLQSLAPSALPRGRTVDWGAGGGANAVAFAPLCRELIAVDVSQPSLDECGRQVSSVCDTPVTKVAIEVARPEAAVDAIGEASCDLFICLHVMELVPSPEYGVRVLQIAERLLRTGGLAFVQIKYSTSARSSKPRRRAYRRDLANMTTYAIDDFWKQCIASNLRPHAVQLDPSDGIDERYAYFLVSKPFEG